MLTGAQRIVSEKPILAQTNFEASRVVIYDRARLSPPGVELFKVQHWPQACLLDGGRGRTYGIRADFGDAVLRHYRRGGFISRFVEDRYLWTGAARSRPVREFELLAQAHAAGLRVPRPIAAQVLRFGAVYSGDLIMARIVDGQKLSNLLLGQSDWTRVNWAGLGNVIGRAHASGFEHADLNAHNVLSDSAGRFWIIDWDRGRRSDPQSGSWTTANLLRLQRSLRKLFQSRLDEPDARKAWSALVEAHARAVRAATAYHGPGSQ